MATTTLHILVDKKNARLQYIASEFVERRIGLTTVLTTDVDVAKSADCAFNYSSVAVNGIPAIEPAKLLYEKRIQLQEIQFVPAPVPKLFPLKNHPLGFDPLAAAFYLLSRYEEYLPRRNDVHDRYEEDQHILVANGAHQMPLVELYADLFLSWLVSYFPGIERRPSNFTPVVTIDVDQLYSLKAKGLVGSAFGLFKDLITLKGFQRLRVLLGREVDPNDIYFELLSSCKASRVPSIVFVQVGDGSKHDINNPPHLYTVRQRINEIGLQSEVGLHPSYFSSENPELFEKEINRLRSMTALPITRSRQHYLRFKLPSTFKRLIEIDIKEDYSMGFHGLNGFRAGTCKPFFLYDLEREEPLPILMFPSSWMDMTVFRSEMTQQGAIEEIMSIQRSVKAVGGMFITTWHPEVLISSRPGFSTRRLFDHFVANAWS